MRQRLDGADLKAVEDEEQPGDTSNDRPLLMTRGLQQLLLLLLLLRLMLVIDIDFLFW